MTLGAALKAARKSAELTQKDLARQLDVVHTYVAHMENGTMPYAPSGHYLVGVAKATGADIDELCFRAEKVAPDLLEALTTDREFLRQVRALWTEKS